VARAMGAAELLDYPRDKLRGLVLEDGAQTSHVVIVARAMGIPVVGQLKGAVSMSDNGDAIIVDGDDGRCICGRSRTSRRAYAEKVRFRARRQQMFRELRDAVEHDQGRRCNRPDDECRPAGRPAAAGGIGRGASACSAPNCSSWSPRPFRAPRPRSDFYRSVLQAARGKPVTFRTIDIGGDKVLPYFKNARVEENPALGWRAIRLTLDRPAC
jgi:phosphotransferase system enzyme I (PtsP)